jgi:hypothetical protein
VEFGVFVRSLGLRERLRTMFAHLKQGRRVVYPMHEQLQLLMDLHVAGEGRVFGLEAMAHDPLFVALAGGAVPSIDTLYDDLARFGPSEISSLEALMAEQTTSRLKQAKLKRVHMDIDTSVTVLFGNQEGALPGPNSRYHGRPSYHPMLARVAEVDGIVGAQLRPGDTGFGEADVPRVLSWVDRVRDAVGPDTEIITRIDGAGDCAALLEGFASRGVHYVTKADMTADLIGAIATHKRWRTVDVGADGKPSRQVATITFARKVWNERGLAVRVVVVRSRERENGKQIFLWEDLDYTVQAFLTNDWLAPEDEIATTYNDRAGIEPIIGELKGAWCIGKAPSAIFDANHAAFLIKLLAYNVFRAFVATEYTPLARWRTPWARRAIILRPGRLCRSGRSRTLRTTPVIVPMRC